MAAGKISKITARTILDSRGEWTVEAEVELENTASARAAVPAGRSRGHKEDVAVLAKQAVQNIEQIIAPKLIGQIAAEQRKVDETMLELDGTAEKSNLGANSLLAVSLAVARASARNENQPLWHYLNQFSDRPPATPRLLANLINGGQHAGNNLSIQEFLIIPETDNLTTAIQLIQKFYLALKELLAERYGRPAINLGDEGGFAPNLNGNEVPLTIFTELSDLVETPINFGLDAAGVTLPNYSDLAERYPLTYLEDPAPEDNPSAWRNLKRQLPEKTTVVGDDLTTTDPKLIASPETAEAINGVIIKPNQIGTLTETLAAVAAARSRGWKIFVSHRSGETNDDFIADLAYGLGADGIKLGAPARGERVAKYNRLLEIEQETLEN